MKKITSLLLLCISVVNILMFTACEDRNSPNNCIHNYVYYNTTATCKNNGYTTMGCLNCGDKYDIFELAYGCYDYDENGYCDECYSPLSSIPDNEECYHVWEEATCQYPKTCTRCGKTTGSKIDHHYSYSDKGHCEYCGKERPNYYLTYTLGDTCIYESYSTKFQFTFGANYVVQKADAWLISQGVCDYVVKIPVIIKNLGTTSQGMNDAYYHLYNSQCPLSEYE